MRIQLVVQDDEYMRIVELKQQIGASTIKEVFNNAMTLFQWAVGQRMEGASIYSIDEAKGLKKELQMYALNRAAEKATPPAKPAAAAATAANAAAQS